MEDRMSLKEAERLNIMREIDKKILTIQKASETLGVSLRQAKRIRKRYLTDGARGLISKHRGKGSPNKIDPKLKDAVVKILHREEYSGFGPTFAQETLRRRHGYYLSEETVRKWMIEAGLWKARKSRGSRVYQRRVRRSRFGELLQGDGSRHAWFEKRGAECTLVIFVDDATSKLTVGKFVAAETTEAYEQLLEEQLKTYGRPHALYVDKHRIFRISGDTRKGPEAETHFGRVLRELDIELICAHSPQAKGRVERANGTLQDRLIKEMRLRKISTMEEANAFLPEFIKDYNERFGKAPRDQENAHRRLRLGDDLERIFSRRATRKLSKDLSFQYEGILYQLHPKYPHRLRSTQVDIFERPGKPLVIEVGGREQRYTPFTGLEERKPKVLDSKELEAYFVKKPQYKPKKHHPWR